MRERKATDKTVSKTLHFLEALQAKCEGTEWQDYTTSQLHQQFNVSKSTFSTCLKLGIVKKSKEGLEFLKENPNKDMALQVLGVLLENAKKQIVTPISPEWITPITDALQEISEKISIGIQQNKNRLNEPKIAPKEPSLFSAQEKRDEQKFDLLKAIAGGVYEFATPFVMNESDTATIDSTNEFILKATDNLFTKYYAK